MGKQTTKGLEYVTFADLVKYGEDVAKVDEGRAKRAAAKRLLRAAEQAGWTQKAQGGTLGSLNGLLNGVTRPLRQAHSTDIVAFLRDVGEQYLACVEEDQRKLGERLVGLSLAASEAVMRRNPTEADRKVRNRAFCAVLALGNEIVPRMIREKGADGKWVRREQTYGEAFDALLASFVSDKDGPAPSADGPANGA